MKCAMESWSENLYHIKYPALPNLCPTEETVIRNLSLTSFDSVNFCFP